MAAKEASQLPAEVQVNMTAETLTYLPSRFGCADSATRRKKGRQSERSMHVMQLMHASELLLA